ncbi:glycosyltransferase 87 family protein [Marinigracilibium pacificum]|uniref:DUF2029 domain-containing protein n=1 Tax=Marinigracilibium pacificum TaxID=2729599 RepID=A0A848J1F5_9BACT|nr:glycosyltransferase 87 family protein [Marinigracilibium pacificum]NMM49511.1 DUF2029 domain-containing protein [Marinigracilibium pacificum]
MGIQADKSNSQSIFGAIILAISILYQGLFVDRLNDLWITLTYISAFAGYFVAVFSGGSSKTRLYTAVLIRVGLIFIIPWLSEDIYRFIWDGALWKMGIHPFSETPSHIMANVDLTPELQNLYHKLNSPNYFTIYPPVYQAIGYLSSFLLPISDYASIIFIKGILVIAELSVVSGFDKLSKFYPKASSLKYAYLLNPLVIIEGAGNAHFEIILVPALIYLIYYIKSNKFMLTGITLGVGIGIKLLPLIFAPYILLKAIQKKEGLKFMIATAITCMLLFFPIFDLHFIKGLSESTSLYFQKFEFNASIYYLIREAGFMIKGYNPIQTVGPILSIITTLAILAISWRFRKSDPAKVLFWLWLAYLLFATTVHPWYVIPLIGISTLNNYRSAMVWSFFVFFTYLGYYESGYKENYLLIVVEYVVLGAAFLFDLNYLKFNKTQIANE